MGLIHQIKKPQSAQEIAEDLRRNQRPAEKIMEGMKEALDVAQGKAKPFKEHKPKPAGERLIKAAKGIRKQVQVAAVKESLPTEPKRRGRPSSGKTAIKIRIDNDVLVKFKASGDGWQTAINAALRKHLEI